MAGSYEFAVACGVEGITRGSLGSSVAKGPGKPFGSLMMKRYDDVQFNQGLSANMIAERWKIGCSELDESSLGGRRAAVPIDTAPLVANSSPYP